MKIAPENGRTASTHFEAIGVTSSSFMRLLASTDDRHRMVLGELPRIMRDELELRIIDINSTSLGSHDPRHIAQFRRGADRCGCVITNLKVNERDLPFASRDAGDRERAFQQYEHWIRAAATLGARWLRPYLTREKPDGRLLLDGYRRLIDLAAPHGITLLVENFLWIDSEPDAIPELLRELDYKIAVSPDTGNWSTPEFRRAGLARAFLHAVTCDFKARDLGPGGEHPDYDLAECFRIGWDAGFRGPWCLEHINADRPALFRELRLLRDLLARWMMTSTAPATGRVPA